MLINSHPIRFYLRCFLAAFLLMTIASSPSWGQVAGQGGGWWNRAREFRSKYYAVKTDLPEAEAVELATHMDATCEAYVRTFSDLPVRVRRPAALRLLLFADQADYMQVLRERLKVDGRGSWGMCITRGSEIYLVGFRGKHSVERMKPLLQHEGFHQFASHLFTGLPPWANEGLAEVFERGVMADNHLVLGAFPQEDQRGLRMALESNRTKDFQSFFAIDRGAWNDRVVERDAATNYIQAWSMVHFFLYGKEGAYRPKFLAFLVTLNRSSDWQTAFLTSMGIPNFEVLESEWSQHVRESTATDYPGIVRRMDFLAAGLLHLSQQDKYPRSMQDLKTALRETQFKHTTQRYGSEVTLQATDPASFKIPFTEDGSARFRLLPQARATALPQVVTVGTTPAHFSVGWRRKSRKYVPVLSAGSSSSAQAKKIAATLARLDRTQKQNANKKADTTPGYRKWKTADGKFETVARVVDFDGQTVELEKRGQGTVRVKLELLSEEDVAYLKQLKEKQAADQAP